MASGRIERCYTDNIYLIESIPPEEDFPNKRQYLIMGNSGKTYKVTISNYPTCTCPDYTFKHRRCKHIYFVLIRIMNTSNYMERKFEDEELEEMFSNIPDIAKNLMYEGEKPTEQKEVNQKFDKDDVCPICLDPLENGKDLDYCKYSCGKTIHKKCFSMWEKSKGGICVFCRGKWYSDNPPIHPKKVSMHPIEEIQIEQEDNKNNNNNNNNNYEKIEIEKEDDDEHKNEIINEKNKNKNKNKKRQKREKKDKNDYNNKKRNRKKNKNKEESMSISEDRSRSRSRNKSRSRSRKKIKYPKE